MGSGKKKSFSRYILKIDLRHNLSSKFLEVEKADETWNSFVDRFPEIESIHPEVRKIGAKLGERAEDLDR